MADNETLPVVETPEPQVIVLDPLAQWIEDHKVELTDLRDEVVPFWRMLPSNDDRGLHLNAIIHGISNLIK